MKPLKKQYKDDNELIDEFCLRKKCQLCNGFDQNGEPCGYGCKEMEKFVEKYGKGY
jgi:hypothetical protein